MTDITVDKNVAAIGAGVLGMARKVLATQGAHAPVLLLGGVDESETFSVVGVLDISSSLSGGDAGKQRALAVVSDYLESSDRLEPMLKDGAQDLAKFKKRVAVMVVEAWMHVTSRMAGESIEQTKQRALDLSKAFGSISARPDKVDALSIAIYSESGSQSMVAPILKGPDGKRFIAADVPIEFSAMGGNMALGARPVAGHQRQHG